VKAAVDVEQLEASDIEELAALCRARGWTVGLAESCTGGLLSSWICERPGISNVFAGAVVSYARKVKERLLDVPVSLMQAHGEVSVPVARAMAVGGRKALDCTWCVSITGIAGPSGGSAEKPVGTVCFAVSGPGVEEVSWQVFPAGGGRQDIQRQAAIFAFDFLLSAMR
jgi:PncC family amidohydrolase